MALSEPFYKIHLVYMTIMVGIARKRCESWLGENEKLQWNAIYDKYIIKP